MRPHLVLGSVAIVGFLLPCTAWGQSVTDPLLSATTYACCPQYPTSMTFLPPGPGGDVDLLVLEKYTGRVRHFRNGVLRGTALDLPVSSDAERGLLGIALHPDFAANRYVYLCFTASPTQADTFQPNEVLDNRIVRYTWSDSLLTSPQLILKLPGRPDSHHQGGVILFGPDRMLYGVIGDIGRFGRMQNNATGPPPDTTSVLYRVRDDGTAPTDNPFYAMGGAMQVVYGYGIRNSFGFEFDPQTGVLWQTENGPGEYDEVNRFLPGFNSGWIRIWGPVGRDPEGTSDLWIAPGSQYTDPQFSWFITNAPTAIHFLHTDSLGAQNRDDIFIGSYNDRAIYHFELDAGRANLVMPAPSVADRVADTLPERDLFQWAFGFGGGIVDLDTGPDGAMYAAAFDNHTIYRIGRRHVSDVGPPGTSLRLVVHPNPFFTAASLRLVGVADPAAVLRIYTAAGRLVRVLAGHDVLVWDGTDVSGRPVAAGTYLARLESADGRPAVQAKIVRLR